MSLTDSKPLLMRWTVSVLLTLMAMLVYGIYAQGFTAGFQFDDAPSLGGLVGVNDLWTALAYLFDGRAGAAGRSLSLLTFLLQKDSWPNDPAAFFRVNTLIHLTNGLLIYWLVTLLARRFPGELKHPHGFALAVTALWLTLPLHVSASLMAVQRMATLSTLFMLLGLIGYVIGRIRLDQAPKQAWKIMTLSVVVSTLLATLCKENGALLPLYVLILELTLMPATGPAIQRRHTQWRLACLGLPLLLLTAYFIYFWPTLISGYAIRPFTLHERLLTETRILWDYLAQILLPARHGLGPYHDDYPYSQGLLQPLSTLISILAWVGVMTIAVKLRHRAPVLLFGLLWYLGGHLIESSFLPLELYFEHRSYLPSLGPLLAVVALLWRSPEKIARAVWMGLVLMVVLRLFVLSETTSVWGQPLVAARLWVEEHPKSPRAAQYLARVYFDWGDAEAARRATLEGDARIRTDTGLALQSVYMSCQHGDKAAFLSLLTDAQKRLQGLTGGATGPDLLNKMLDARLRNGCPDLEMQHLFDAADALLANRYNQGLPGVLAALHIFKYRLYETQGRKGDGAKELLLAFSLKKELVIAVAAANAIANAGRYDKAMVFLDDAEKFAPLNPVLKRQWLRELDRARIEIQHVASATKGEG